MENNVIHFVLDSFMHYKAEDEVDDFVRGLVGKKVLLMPDDNCDVDRNCIEGFYMGEPCCHASARKAPVLREIMRTLHKRSMLVEVKSHNLDKGYKTVLCEVEAPEGLTDDFMAEHERLYGEWTYEGKTNVAAHKHRLLMANTDYLLDSLADENASEDDLTPVIDAYMEVVPMAFSKEDKENCIRVNIMLQNSPIEAVRAYNQRLVDVLDHLNHPELRINKVRAWIDELKASNACRREAATLDEEQLARRVDNLRDFPENLYECYEDDFATFCGNLYYNQIPCWEQQQFMNGVAVCELARERLERSTAVSTEAAPSAYDLLGRLLPMFKNDREVACRFIKETDGAKPTQVTEVVNRMLKEDKVLRSCCKGDLWRVLHDFGIYKPGKSNWNCQVNG